MNNTTTAVAATYPSVDISAQAQTARRLVVPGLAAGAAFLGFEMLAGAFSTSMWAFPQSIPQTVGLTAPTAALDPLALVLGVAIHLAFSIGLGMVFIGLARSLGMRGTLRLLIAGVLFMWAESAISIWAVLHTLFPSTLTILFSAMPIWASFAGRTAFGLVLASL